MSSEPMTNIGRLVDEHRHVRRRLLQTGKLQLTVERRSHVRVARLRCFVGADKDVADPCSAHGLIHEDEAPRLAIANRGRELCEAQQLIESSRVNWLVTKASDVTPPCEQFVKLPAEIVAEFRWL